MSADMDDLAERIELARDRNIPTVAEVRDDLMAALDELERDFPNGRPRDGENWLRRARYMSLFSRVEHGTWQLKNGQCVEFPRGRESDVEPNDAEWQDFLESHPELERGADG